MGRGTDVEDRQDGEGHGGDRDGEAKRQLDPRYVETHEHRVRRQPPERSRGLGGFEDRSQVPADPDDDHRRRQDVLHILRQPRHVSAPGAHGRAREGIGATGVGHRRRHFGDAEAEPDVHDGDDEGRDQQAPEAAGRQSEVPAKEVPRDNGAHPQRPQGADPGVTPQSPPLEIIRRDLGVGDGPPSLGFGHETELRNRRRWAWPSPAGRVRWRRRRRDRAGAAAVDVAEWSVRSG